MLIAAAPCAKLASNILSSDLTEPALVGSRGIFIDTGANSKCIGPPIFLDLTEALFKLLKLFLCDDARLCICRAKAMPLGTFC
jgi:hypothetical protein